ncbi:hypothetical protein B296_00005010 [Ensete ventricosum]|uniref:Bromo domain-containing protein n=1 Tax=Ensete ventricosum TaxID=4639 RepID=A0A427B2S9_ENSVE|nr:hypothetical protein B296_00005010 [Ensete ventricosum]
MYQRRRLGILGMEWRPTSLKLAVGPTYNVNTGDFQPLPIMDLEPWVEPLPEVVDAVDWEMENDMQSDDTDSEYNVTEEYSTEGEHESLSNSSCEDVEISVEDNSVDHDGKDGLRRSKRKKHKYRRIAKTNALTFFSKITGVSTDGEDEDESDSSSSESESAFPDSKILSIESERSMLNNQLNDSKDNRDLRDGCEGAVKPSQTIETQTNMVSKRRLVLKLPSREPRTVVSGYARPECHKQDGASVSLPVTNSDVTNLNRTYGSETADLIRQTEMSSHNNSSADRQHSTIKWGEVKQRSSKRPKFGDMATDVWPVANRCPDGPGSVRNDINVHAKPEDDCGPSNSRMQANENGCRRIVYECKQVDDVHGITGTRVDVFSPEKNSGSFVHQQSTSYISEQDQIAPPMTCNDNRNDSVVPMGKDPISSDLRDLNIAFKGPEMFSIKNENLFGTTNNVDENQQVEKNVKTIYPKLRIKSRELVHDTTISSSKLKSITLDGCSPEGDVLSNSAASAGRNLTSVAEMEDEETSGRYTDHGKWNSRSESSEGWTIMIIVISTPLSLICVLDQFQGHKEYIENSGTPEAGPWESVKGLKAVEFCKVRDIEYATLPGSGDSCCKLTLKFLDPFSGGYGKAFKCTLPELTGFPDFLVERTRYDASIERNWTHRDKCHVWWRNANGDGGGWWAGRILAVKPKSSEFPESPWERYVIQYKDDSSGHHFHSPWELNDTDTHWKHPCIDDDTTDNLLKSIAKIEQASVRNELLLLEKDINIILALCHDKLLNSGQHKCSFATLCSLHRYPVPLSLEVIKRRLENCYYRTVDAVKHDAYVMISNAESYFSRSADMMSKMHRLSEWIMRTFPSS